MTRGRLARALAAAVVGTALAILLMQGCATAPITDGVPGRVIDGLHEETGHRAAPPAVFRGAAGRWGFDAAADGMSEGGGPEPDPDEPHPAGAPLYW